MKLLLDTHILLWMLSEPERITEHARDAIEDLGNTLLLSAVSAWEIATKHALGKLPLPETPQALMERAVSELRAVDLPITASHAMASAILPNHHRDPFDRLLVAQAIAERATLITADGMLPPYASHGVTLLWARP